MLQQILIGILFLGALGFLINVMVRSFRSKAACASGCGKCAMDTAPAEWPGKATPKP